MLRLTAKPMIDSRATLGEGLQLFPNGNLTWVDIDAGHMHVIEAGRDRLLRKFPHHISKVLPWLEGYLVFGSEDVYGFNDLHQQLFCKQINPAGQNLRFSDGAVLPDGSVLIGVLDKDLAENQGFVLRIHKDWSLETIVERATIPNGTAVTAKGDMVFWVDSPSGEISQFHFDSATGELGPKERFVELDPELGTPDGICADQEGGLWVALWGGGRVIRLSPSGRIDCEISVGTPNVTSVAFSKNHDLLISTATATLSAEESHRIGAGGIWVVPSGAHGRKGVAPLRAKLISQKFKIERLSNQTISSTNN